MRLLLAAVGCSSDAEPTVVVDVPIPGDPLDGLPFDDHRALVVPNADGLALVDAAGGLRFDVAWDALVGSCGGCGGEGASVDGDGLLVSFTTGGMGGGAIARLDEDAVLDLRVDGFGFPHDAIRDPADGAIVVPEVDGSRVRWVAGDGSSPDALRALDSADPDWPRTSPNGADRFDHDGRSLLLLSHRGSSAEGPLGAITLWDVTEVDHAALVWTYPPRGALDTPHGPVFRRRDGRWWLLYAHTRGKDGAGTVGLAVTSDPRERPTYVADLTPDGPVGPFGYLRGVELAADGTLYLTDSGSLGTTPGRIVQTPFPNLVAAGAGGQIGDQVFVPFEGTPFVDGLVFPFEAWLWTPGPGY